MLDRQKVQRIAFERMALSSQCLSRHGCILRHQVHHTDALFTLDMLVSHTRSAAQPQVWSRKTTAGAEACKILLLLLCGPGYALWSTRRLAHTSKGTRGAVL